MGNNTRKTKKGKRRERNWFKTKERKKRLAIIAAANKAALIAPSSPIASVPTGIPLGICAIDNKLSKPLSFLLSTGTPSTGTCVSADTIPGR